MNVFGLIIYYFVVSLICLCFFKNVLPYVQSENYSLKFGLKRYLKTRKKRHVSVILLFLVFNIALIISCVYKHWLMCNAVQFIIFALLLWDLIYSKNKLKLTVTNRIKRLLLFFVVVLIVFYLFILLVYSKCESLQRVQLFYNFFGVVIIVVSLLLSFICEKIIAKKYIIKAQKKLKSIKDLKVIGIVGSYAKTSIKVFLDQILSVKYSVCSTPKNYNTMLGISKTILENLDHSHDILILEIGADRKDDIKKILKVFNVDMGILTGINNQHVEKFGSINNLIKTKFYIAEYCYKLNIPIFVNFFNINDDMIKRLFNDHNHKVVDNNVELINKCIVSNDNNINIDPFKKLSLYINKLINFESDYIQFDIWHNDIQTLFVTRLEDEYKVRNLIVAISVAMFLGFSFDEIQTVVRTIKSANDRMELKKLKGGALLINNSYNSNVNSCDVALNLLCKYEDKIKLVITPGLIELGKFQFEENLKFGEKIGRLGCDLIVSNLTNLDALRKGYSGVCGKSVKVFNYFSSSLSDYINSLSDDYVVLIENDLPDNYV